MPRRSSSAPSLAPDLPAHLRHVLRAAARECPRGHAGALRDLTTLAVRKVPSRGIFDPTSRAALQVQSVSDTAYFYAGLAFGLTWLSVYRDR